MDPTLRPSAMRVKKNLRPSWRRRSGKRKMRMKLRDPGAVRVDYELQRRQVDQRPREIAGAADLAPGDRNREARPALEICVRGCRVHRQGELRRVVRFVIRGERPGQMMRAVVCRAHPENEA